LISKTVNPVHFEDLSGTQFERLVFAYHLKVGWTNLTWYGQCGSDDGRDIGGNEPMADGRFRRVIIQCVNRGTLTLSKAAQDMKRAVAASPEPLTSFKFVCRGNISARQRTKITELARLLGISHVPIWSGIEFEEHLRQDAQSLLKRFVEGVEFPDAEGLLRHFVDGASPAELLSNYQHAFTRMYGPVAADLVPVSYRAGNQPMTSSDVLTQIIDRKQSTLLRGPSGCGKSMLAAKVGLGFFAAKGVAILLQGKDMNGALDEALDREAMLLGAASSAQLLDAGRSEGRAILIIVDGYNECNGIDRLTLTRSLAKLASDQGSCLLVTSQLSIERGDLLSLSEVTVEEPDVPQKVAIAALAFGGESPLALQPLLDSVSNGLEARLVGEVGRALPPAASRYALFDAYARKRLGAWASEGINLLSKLAEFLTEQVSFSLSVRDLDRFLATERISPSQQYAAEAANLLVRRGDRVSFQHELFFNAFAAEGALRRAGENVDQILRSLSLPRYADARVLLIGAIDDERLLTRVLPGIADPVVLFACLRGECGSAARCWLEDKVPYLIARAREEVAYIGFAVGAGWQGAGVDRATVFARSASEDALLTVLTASIWQGEHLDDLMEIVAAMDRRLEEGVAQLRGLPELPQNISLRSALFADVYVFSSSDSSAITRITSAAHQGSVALSGLHARRQPPTGFFEWPERENLTNGQLYVMIALCQQMNTPKESYGGVLPRWLQDWKRYPYHLRLDLLHLAVCCGRVGEPQRSVLIETLKNMLASGNLGLIFNGSVMEALERLGGLEDEEQAHMDAVRSQIQEILSAPEEPELWTQAAHLYGCQFDHPYSGAYWEAVQELADSDRRTLLWMAAKGWGEYVMLVPILLMDLAKYHDRQCLDAISRWARLPEIDTSFPQEAIESFVIAHIVLGRFDCELPDSSAETATDAAAALSACGKLFYWMSRPREILDAERTDAYRSAWTVLVQYDQGVALCCLYLCGPFVRRCIRDLGELGSLPSLTASFPELSASVCREALYRPDVQKGYFPHFIHDSTEAFQFAIDVISQHGGPGDIRLLKVLSDHRDLGRSAISAIKRLEGVHQSGAGVPL
jgi:hypothetical protein